MILETLFRNIDLSIAEKQLKECYHTTGSGRPPRSQIGLLRALIIMCMKGIRSLRRLCLVKPREKVYTRSVISRFTRRGVERLQLIIEEKVVHLLRRSRVEEVDAVLDPSFIKAWSIRHLDDGKIGFSDADVMVVRNGRGYYLGYKLHLSVDPKRMLPLAILVAPANDNEKKHAPTLIERIREVLGKVGARQRRLIGDSQFR